MDYIQGTFFGKTFPEPSQAMTGKTLALSSANSPDLLNQNLPMCLCLRLDGNSQAFYWSVTGRLLTELMMRNFGERPNEERESHLSSVLEGDTQRLRKYYLSPAACQGILNRAKRRGKELPELLKRALIAQSRSKSVAGK